MEKERPAGNECPECDGFKKIEFKGPFIQEIACPKCCKKEHDRIFRKILKERLKGLGRLLDYDYKDLEINPRLRKRLDRFVADKEGEGLTLWGRVGRGKTTIAAAAVIEKGVRQGIWSVRYVHWPIQVKRLRGAFDKDRNVESEFEQMEQMMKPTILILDEIGTKEGKEEKSSSYNAGALHDIVDERYRMRRYTVVTMNTNIKELDKNLGQTFNEKIISRLIQMNDEAIELGGPNRRMAKCKQRKTQST